MLLELAHHGRDRGLLLPDRHVDALNAGALLVDDRVDGYRGLADLAIANDQFTLAATDRDHCIDRLQPGLHRLGNRLARDHARSHLFDRLEHLGIDRTLAIDRAAQRIDHASLEFRANRHFEHAPGAAAGLAFLEALVFAQHNRADRIALEVERHPVHAALELDHLAVHHLGQAVNPHDTVGHADDGALVLGLGADVEPLDTALDDFTDFRWVQLLHLGFL